MLKRKKLFLFAQILFFHLIYIYKMYGRHISISMATTFKTLSLIMSATAKSLKVAISH